jgi:hypothetical protein
VWRDLTNDWGEDVLAHHYRRGHAAAGGPHAVEPTPG